MQQLNFLSITATQNVDIKDGSPAIFSPSLKDGFSQHIESHLAKNKDVPYLKSEGDGLITVPINSNDEPSILEQKESEVENDSGENKDSVTLAQLSTDEHNLVNETQEVAATGNNSEIKSNQKTPDTVNQGINESELLMSFLTKADKTLVAKAVVDTEKDGQSSTDKDVMSSTYPKNAVKEVQFDVSVDDQKIKQVAPLLNSSDLSTDLSSVAKVVGSSAETDSEYLLEQDKSLDLSKSNTKKTKESSETEKLLTKSIIDTTDNTNVKKTDDKASREPQTVKMVEVDPNNLTTERNQAELIQQKFTPESVSSDMSDIDSHNVVKSLRGNQDITSSGMSSIVSQAKSQSEKEVLVSSDKVQNENAMSSVTISQVADDITTVIAKDKTALSQSGLSQPAISQPSISQHSTAQVSITTLSSERLGRTGTELLINENSLTESEEQFSVKAAENLIAQTKSDVTVENKDVGTKAIANTLDKANTAFAFNVTASEAINRATQAAYDRIDHQAIDMVNPMGSTDLALSQKTNIQLHHETIAIFRKDFSDAVKDKVMLMISQKLQQFDITLDPPELGNMQVRVNLQGEQATVNFIVQNQHAKEALDQNMHKLREMLAEQGVDVGDANVEQQSQQSNNNETADDKPGHSAINTADASDVIEHNLSAKRVDSTTQVIDYYA